MSSKTIEVIEEQQQAPVSKERKITIRAPREPGEDQSVLVAINGKNYIIPRGISVEVPEDVAILYDDMYAAKDAYDKACDRERKRMNVVEGAPV